MGTRVKLFADIEKNPPSRPLEVRTHNQRLKSEGI